MGITTTYTPTVTQNEGGGQTTVYSTSQNNNGVPIPPVAQTTAPVMTATGLSSVAAPANVAPPAPNTTATTALQSSIGSVATPSDPDSQAALIAAKIAAQGNAQDSLQALVSELTNKTSTATATDQAYAANNNGSSVYADQNAVTKAQAAIDSEKLALANKITAIQKNTSGSFGGNVDQQIQQETDASTARQANLAIILATSQGDYASAKNIADAAVAASTQAEQNKIDTLQTIYTANKDLFSTAEQEEFTAAQATRAAALDEQKQEQLAQFNETIKQNDPLYKAQVANENRLAGIGTPGSGIEPTNPTMYTLQSGDDPAVVATQNGTNIAALKAANPQITDWTKIQPGTALNLPASTTTDFKNGIPITAAGAAKSGGQYDTQAYALATGLAAPSQYLSGRSATTPAGLALTARANAISMATLGIPFNPAASEAAFKFRNSSQYQKLANNAPTAIQTIVQAAQSAKNLNLTNLGAFNQAKINALAGGYFPGGTPQQQSDAQNLKSFLALNQDDLGLILGSGTGSDYKSKLAGLIFDASGAPLSTTNLSSAMVNKITDKLGSYYTAAGVPNGKAFAQQTAQELVNSASQDNTVQTPGAAPAVSQASTPQQGDTHVYNGVTYVVQNGNWVPQQ